MRLKSSTALFCGALSLAASAASAVPTLTTLATFNGSNGSEPEDDVIVDASGNVYGTTYEGGASNYGTVFEVAAHTNNITTLVTFNGSNGKFVTAGLVADAAGNLYGTTENGGTNGSGTAFEIAAGTHAFSTLVSFVPASGAAPAGGLIVDKSGNLYGTTFAGGLNNDGTVYEIAAKSQTITTLATFNSTNGAEPLARLVTDAAGNLYGTTSQGGRSGDGTVFKVSVGTNTITTLATFDGTNGSMPNCNLVRDTSGNLYGTTTGIRSSDGTVFEIPAATGILTTIATFNGSDGEQPQGELITDMAGNLYGTTEGGGTPSLGTVFEIAANTHTLSTLSTFGFANGSFPSYGVTADASGNLYGTTFAGPNGGDGTVFELTNTGFVAPEPSSLGLLCLGGVALLRRRKRGQISPANTI